MRETSTPRAARKPVRLSNRSSAALIFTLASLASVRSSAATLSGSPVIHRKRSISNAISCGSEVCATERGLLEKAVGDLADRAAADGVDAGDREQVDHQRVRRLGIGARHGRQHALVFRARAGGLDRQHVEVALETAGAVEILHQAALPGRREIEAFDQRREQADVAHADFGSAHAEFGERFKSERQHLGVGGRGVGAAERLDAGLQEFIRVRRRPGGTPGPDSRSRPLGRPPPRPNNRAKPRW